MTIASPFAITISRELGSGGSVLGQRLARRLGCKFADHEILQQAAAEMGDDPEMLAARDETAMRFWERMMACFATGPVETTYQALPPIPSDYELYTTENAIIARLAREENAVIVGHGGFYVLREHPRHVSLFFHAPPAFRRRRLQEWYQLTEAEAWRLLERTDGDRERYVQAMCQCCRTDLRNYHLTLDTSRLDFPALEAFLLDYLAARGITPAAGDAPG